MSADRGQPQPVLLQRPQPSERPQSASSPLSSPLAAALLGVGVIGAGALLWLAWRRWQQGREQRTASGAGSSSSSPSSPASLLGAVDGLIERLSRGELDDFDVAQYRSLLTAAAAASAAPATSPAAAAAVSPASYLSLIRLFTTYHTVRNLMLAQQQQQEAEATGSAAASSSLQAAVDQWEAEQAEDLSRAWALLQQAGEADSSALRLLSLELAQRLKHGPRLQSAFDSLLQVPQQQRSEEEVLAAFMTAPILGRWKETRALGLQLIALKGQQAMADFHEAALQEAVYPDFQLLFNKRQHSSAHSSRSRRSPAPARPSLRL